MGLQKYLCLNKTHTGKYSQLFFISPQYKFFFKIPSKSESNTNIFVRISQTYTHTHTHQILTNASEFLLTTQITKRGYFYFLRTVSVLHSFIFSFGYLTYFLHGCCLSVFLHSCIFVKENVSLSTVTLLWQSLTYTGNLMPRCL